MAISGVTPNNGYYQSNVQGASPQRASDFKNLIQSLQNGDLSGAQQAYASLQQGFSANSSSAPGQGNPFGTDFQALGQALQSGDLSSAQQALTKLQQDAHKAHGGHHHHAPATDNISQTASTSATQTTGSNIDVKA